MNLPEYIADSKVSGIELAKKLGIAQPVVSAWVTGKKPVPPARCVQLEQITDGVIRRVDLRPNDFWKFWPDLSHLAPASPQPAAPVNEQGV